MHAIRPSFPTKKSLRDAVASGRKIRLVDTGMFGSDYSGPVAEAPDGTYYIVGPSEYDRKWYGQVKVTAGQVKIS